MGLGKGIIGMSLLGLMTVGCQNKVAKERDAAIAQSREAQAQADAANAQLRNAPDPNAYAALQQENARLQQQVSELEQSLKEQPAGQNDPALAGIETSYNAAAGTMTVNLPGDVLFASGSTELKSSAQQTLNKVVAAIKKDYAGKRIVVNGHTDADPINRTKNKFEDNYDLAYARAKSVRTYMTKQGVPDKSLALAAYGPNDPKNPTNKAQNRRVEIVVHTKS